jgi:hypothetical protein
MTPRATELQPTQEAIVLSVRPDPEPCEILIFQKPQSPISESHADGVDGVAIVNLLEVKAGVLGIFEEQAIGLPSEVSDVS